MGGRPVRGAAGVAAMLALAPAAATAEMIAPGVQAHFFGKECTLNFVFDGVGDDAGRVFVGTAAHCTPMNLDESRDMWIGGQRVLDQGTVVGKIAARGAYYRQEGDNSVPDDWALVEILPQFRRDVDPAVVGHPQYPSRVVGTAEMGDGDMLQFSGHGMATSATEPTREQRQGVYLAGDGVLYESLAPVTQGDSGGPVVDVNTGGALGVVSSHSYPWFHCSSACSLTGPTIDRLIAGAGEQGLTVQLRAAGQPAPARPVIEEPAAEPAPAAAAPAQATAPAATLALSTGCLRRGRLTFRVDASVPLASVLLTAPRRRAIAPGRVRLTGLRGRRVKVAVTAVARDGGRLSARRTFAACRR